MGKSAAVLLFLIITMPLTVRGQCSDGGVCTLSPATGDPAHAMSLQYVYGKSPSSDSLTFHTLRLAGEIPIFEDSRLDVSLPFTAQSGPLGDVSGIGDLIVIWTQTFSVSQDATLDAQLGGRFATADVNAGGLPQAYQSGLGTNDLLLAVGYSTGPWGASLGYQLSRGRSANSLTRLKRGDDVMARLSYAAPLHDLALRFEVLTIKRLQLSSVRDPLASGSESFVTIPGSDQLQINVLLDLRYPITEHVALSITGAIPLLEREVNVDGLSRSFTLGAGISAEF